MATIAVQWPRLGPLHLDRLRAAHEVLGPLGHRVVAVETASDSAIYQWRIEKGPTSFERITVFPDRDYDDISPRSMHRGMMSCLAELRPDAILIHSYSTPDARAALAWCRRNRRVAILMAESTERDGARNQLQESIKRLIVSQFDSALTSGQRSRDYVIRLGLPESSIFRGYSVVDNEYFRTETQRIRNDDLAARALPGLEDPRPFFLASARFMARKNLNTLLLAFNRYRERAGDDAWRLLLLGDGDLRGDLEATIRDSQIHGVSMPGWRQIEDLPAYYALASAFVHTAEVDQWGLVVNEAMAAGLPVIVSTGTGCSPDLVSDGGNGYVYEPHDLDGLANRMYSVAHEADRDVMARRSSEIIDQWPLSMFGEGLLASFDAGLGRSDRSLDPRAGGLIWMLKSVARSPRAFHTVED